MTTENQGGNVQSLQVSHYGNIPAGEDFVTERGLPFHIKNLTGAPAEVTIVDADGIATKTTIEEGWNPEIVFKLLNAPEGLQWGY